MAGIAGTSKPNANDLVGKMLQLMHHRGSAGKEVVDVQNCTFGICWPKSQIKLAQKLLDTHVLSDETANGHSVSANIVDGRLILKRDKLGVVPLYYAHTSDGSLCFASEAKALFPFARNITELLPGTETDGDKVTEYFRLTQSPILLHSDIEIARLLRTRLDLSVVRRIRGYAMGSWLSGGLDSSVLAALAKQHLPILHTFAAGTKEASDLLFAREMANHIGSIHHELIVDLDQMTSILPKVIYHLESFDALLVRSSIMNFLVAQLASEYVEEVFSGEGGDELFGGYEYLKELPLDQLPAELIDITSRLHNTALQRVDRSASAHGTIAHTAFLDPDVVDFALRIPPELKIRDGIEKWILRESMKDLLPESIYRRKKAKFWEGAGVSDMIAMHVDSNISNQDFQRERTLPNGWLLNSKEELMYYRIFVSHFGELEDLNWMGRTKGVKADV